MANIDITDQGSTLNNGVLQLENGVAMDTTLRYVADQLNTKSQLLLATNATTIEGTLKIKTANVEYLDVEDTLGNNRFTISKAVGSQKVDLDFASNPTSPTDIVGGIRTFQDGVNLSDSLFFRKNGQATFTERVNVEGDSSVTTQTSSVIRSTTTNANLVIAPNGTGALVASIPDGTATGGNARGNYAVDLQTSRSAADQVARPNFSAILSGSTNKIIGIDQGSIISGGIGNNITDGDANTISGGTNNRINSTGFTARNTIVGGANNVANGGHTTVGGQENTGGATGNTIFGRLNSSSGQYSEMFGYNQTNSGNFSFIAGVSNISGANNTAMISYQGYAYLLGQFVQGTQWAGGTFEGTFQNSVVLATRYPTLTSGSTAALSLDGSGVTNLIIPRGGGTVGRAWNVTIKYTAIVTAITGTATGISVGDTKTQNIDIGFKRLGAVVSLVGSGSYSIAQEDASMNTATLVPSAGGSQNLALTFTAPTFAGGGSLTLKIIAKIELTEAAH